MRSSHSLDAIAVTFDDERLVADAGLIQPATLAQHLGLRCLYDNHVDLGDAPGHANVGHKAMTVIHSLFRPKSARPKAFMACRRGLMFGCHQISCQAPRHRDA